MIRDALFSVYAENKADFYSANTKCMDYITITH